MTEHQWQKIQQFDAHGKSEHKYTKADKITFWCSGAIILYLICQVARVVL